MEATVEGTVGRTVGRGRLGGSEDSSCAEIVENGSSASGPLLFPASGGRPVTRARAQAVLETDRMDALEG